MPLVFILRQCRVMTCLALLLVIPNAALGQSAPELIDLSLEELLNVTITSVSKKAEKLSEAPAAIFVLTAEDIRRSGASTIADALRLAPGVQVGQIDASIWAISARGYNGRFSNKLLVLIDGRSVYTPMFSGVYWEVQDVMLEDVERIEIIRGPGATLWGANAVNGIINIITKKAADTLGGLITAGGGSEERGFGQARYGTRWGADNHVRFYAKYFDRDAFTDAGGDAFGDQWQAVQGGFRADGALPGKINWTLQGDYYDGELGQRQKTPSFTPPYLEIADVENPVKGGNLLGRLEKRLSGQSDLSLQFYYDRADRQEPTIKQEVTTYDLEFQHRFTGIQRHEVIWGLNFRALSDRTRGSVFARLDPANSSRQLVSAFIQDEVMLVKDRFFVTLGSKFEHNEHTGWEVQPNARLQWLAHPQHTVWGAASRAVRTPDRSSTGISFVFQALPPGALDPNVPFPTLLTFTGSPEFESETMSAYEIGYRFHPNKYLFVDLAGYRFDYDKLSGALVNPAGAVFNMTPTPHLTIPAVISNVNDAISSGFEIVVDCRPTDAWRLRGSYSYLNFAYDSAVPGAAEREEGFNPKHQAALQSFLTVLQKFETDITARFVDKLPYAKIDGYTTFDLHLGYRPMPQLLLSLVGRNLTEARHREFEVDYSAIVSSEVERSFYGAATWKF